MDFKYQSVFDFSGAKSNDKTEYRLLGKSGVELKKLGDREFLFIKTEAIRLLTEVAMDELVPKLKAITDTRGGLDERIFMRADKKADYGTVARVMGKLSGAGFKRLALVTEVEQGS